MPNPRFFLLLLYMCKREVGRSDDGEERGDDHEKGHDCRIEKIVLMAGYPAGGRGKIKVRKNT